jgi:hypothetical protein
MSAQVGSLESKLDVALLTHLSIVSGLLGESITKTCNGSKKVETAKEQ